MPAQPASLPRSGPVTSPDRPDVTGPTGGAGLSVVEGPRWPERLEHARTRQRLPVPSQLSGELYLIGIVGEGLLWPVVGGDLLAFSLVHMIGLGAWIGTSLARGEHQKRSRIAARQTKGTPSWAAGVSTTTC